MGEKMKIDIAFIIFCLPGILHIILSKQLAKLTLNMAKYFFGIDYTERAINYYKWFYRIAGIILILVVILFIELPVPSYNNVQSVQEEKITYNEYEQKESNDIIIGIILFLIGDFAAIMYLLFFDKYFAKGIIKSSKSIGIIESDKSIQLYKYMVFAFLIISLLFTFILVSLYILR